MFDGSMKGNGVERTTPYLWFGQGLRIIWELDVDDIILVVGMRWGCLIVNVLRP